MTNQPEVIDQRGIHDKYHVNRTDAQDGRAGDRHYDCRNLLFTLDPVHDPAARATLRYYALQVTISRPVLSAELHARIDKLDQDHPLGPVPSRSWEEAAERLQGGPR